MKWSSFLTNSTRRNFIVSVIALMVALLVVSGALAQTGTTSVRGTVTDPHGASVPDATLTLTSSEIGVTITTKTDKEGTYQFLEIRPATYSLTITAAGFAKVQQSGLQLLVATPRTNNVKLELSSMTTTVEVMSSAETINTQDATLGGAFATTQLDSIPTEGRDPVAIFSLMPGALVNARREHAHLNAHRRGGSANAARS